MVSPLRVVRVTGSAKAMAKGTEHDQLAMGDDLRHAVDQRQADVTSA